MHFYEAFRMINHKTTFFKIALISVAMFGFGYLLVPLYDVFCEITGLNGKTGQINATQANSTYQPDLTRTITVQFIANHNAAMPWKFAPAVTTLEVHPGKLYTTHYTAHNRTERDMTAQAVPSVAPTAASRHFDKTECFCFTQQHLKAGTSKDMPLQFVIDPKISDKIQTVTLAYSLFDVTQPELLQSTAREESL
ncbi:MAG: cytochrome c oxidase assembly protein [Pseudomonadota bacterium]